MRRRTFVAAALLSISLPKVVRPQASGRVVRLGWIVSSSSASAAPLFDALRDGLADLGYVEGRNLVLEARYGDDDLGRVPALAEELLRFPVDLIITQGTATWGVIKTISTIPVVYVFSADPVEAGFAQSFARPGG